VASTSLVSDEFYGGTASNPGSLGWSVASGTVTFLASTADHPGIIRKSTGTTSGTMANLFMPATNGLALLPSVLFDTTWITRLNTNDTDTLQRLGLSSGVATNPASDGIWIEKLEADTSWFGVCRSGSTQTRTAALLACDTSFHRWRIRRVDASTIGFTVDGGTEVTVTTNIPTAVLDFFFAIRNNVASDKNHDIDYFDCLIAGLNR
jgi:hypothetical protein